MATNIRVKVGKIGLFTFIRSPGIPKQCCLLYMRMLHTRLFCCKSVVPVHIILS